MTHCFILLALLPVLSASAARWDSEGAARAFDLAVKKQNEIAQADHPTLAQYLECARTYRKVYMKDPHYSRAADAVYEEGLVYQEAAERFSKPEYYKTAVRRFRFLVTDYGGNRNCRDALIRIGTILTVQLSDEKAAREAWQLLRTQYGYSDTAIQRIRDRIAAQAARASAPEAAVRSESRSMVRNLRFWSTSAYTRVIVDMDSVAGYEQSRLSEPDRIYFDILNARLSGDLTNRTFAVGDGILKHIRVAQNRPDAVRVVLDISAAADLAVSEMNDPFRIVIDLKRAAAPDSKPAPLEARSAKEAPPAPAKEPGVPPKQDTTVGTGIERSTRQPPRAVVDSAAGAASEVSRIPRQAAPTSEGDRTLTRMLGLKVGRIVIDPGHGGHDFGTMGPGGLLEKDLVLSLARGLKTMIEEKTGAEVFLTRDDDTFISLEERTAVANRHRADLFISIHANSSRIRSISGVETYYLDFARTDAEREIAARENATTVNNLRDLEDLIKKIARADKSTESREFASIVQKKLYSGARRVFPSARNRGVRSAPFIVLIGANMPSILAEVAFISNPKDERLLKKEAARQRLVTALFTGIEAYMKTLGSDAVHNQKSSQSK